MTPSTPIILKAKYRIVGSLKSVKGKPRRDNESRCPQDFGPTVKPEDRRYYP